MASMNNACAMNRHDLVSNPSTPTGARAAKSRYARTARLSSRASRTFEESHSGRRPVGHGLERVALQRYGGAHRVG
jgi:hypothetical protein